MERSGGRKESERAGENMLELGGGGMDRGDEGW